MVLLGLVAVIVAIVLVIVRPGASQGDEVSQTSPPTPTAGAPATDAPATDAPATDAPAEPVASEPPAEAAADGAPCAERQVIVEAITDQQVYAAGEQPNLSVTITNTGPNACSLNVGTAAQVFTVTSGSEAYWTSTDCQVDAVDAQVTLEPNTPVSSSQPIVWDRTRSNADTCGGPRTPVPAGGASYHLAVSVSGFESAVTKQFLLY
jgi:hypothetical protein